MTLPVHEPGRVREESHSFRDAVLRVVDAMRGPLRALRIDVPLFRSLMHLRLTLDSRGRDSTGAAAQWLAQGVLPNLALSGFFGTILALYSAFALAAPAAAGVLAGGLLTFGAMLTISLLATALFDRATATLFAGRPIDDRTALLARVTPAVLYVALIQGALALPQIVALGWRHGMWPIVPVAILIALFATLLASALVLAIFVFSMRIVSAERFKEILARVQLGMSLLLIVGPQVYTLYSQRSDFGLDRIELGAFAILLPPTWYSDMMSVATGVETHRSHLTVILGVVVPLACLWAAIQASSGKFIAAMAAPDVSTSSSRRLSAGLVERIAPWVTRGSLERAGYSLCAALQLRDRASLLTIVPGSVIGVVLTVRFASDGRGSLLAAVPFLAYAIPLSLPQIAMALSRSEFPGAAAIVRASPVRDSQPILAGALRATLVRFLWLPGVAVLVIAAVALGATAAATAVVAGIAATAIACVALGSFRYSLPFSQSQPKTASMGGLSLVKFFLIYVGTILVLELHRGVIDVPALHLGFGVITTAIAYNRLLALRRQPITVALGDEA